LPWWLSGLLAQLYRYRRMSSPTQRQQTKWVLWGLAAGIVGTYAAYFLPKLLFASRTPTALEAFIEVERTSIAEAFLLLAPLSLGVAILHYRLWEIDILINRTLVYVPLTAILAGLFTAGLGLSQRLSIALTGNTSDAAVVLTTLVIAAVFEPIRTGLKATVDRLFRDPPDRARQLKALGDQVRWVAEVIDVAEVTRRLLDEAVAAFEAECGALSLLEGGPGPIRHTRGEWRDDRARLSVPLESGGVRVGLIALGARHSGTDYTATDEQLLRSIAEAVAKVVRLARSP
jgi:GAF domain-containing protein